ncbi:MAG: 4Fe-4S binding protein [Pseudomonadota bacterium]
MEPQILLCDCAGTMAPDAEAITAGCGVACSHVHTLLCRSEATQAAAAIKNGGEVVIACGQEADAFFDLAEDLGASNRVTCVDIRDRAGWTDDKGVGPKMAALIAEARLAIPTVPTMDVESQGICLIYGKSDVALPAAERLATAMSVTVMLTDDTAPDVLPQADIDVVAGQIRAASGALGQFSLEIDRFAPLAPQGRGSRRFEERRDGARSDCDVILDLSGGLPLFPAHHKRDGYVRADPGDPLAVAGAVFDAAQLVGTFEKTLHIRFDESLCAHSRAGQTGCTRCLDLCPTGAISPAGDVVSIDPNICAGCGACAAACPSGAASSDDPHTQFLFDRLRALSDAYRKAGGVSPRLLVHDEHGAEMIRLSARHSRGMPADVIPFEISALSAFGHTEMLTALALGFVAVDILAGPKTERDAIGQQIVLASAVSGPLETDGTLRLVDAMDPVALSDLLYDGRERNNFETPTFLPLGQRRSVTRLAATALAGGTAPETPIALPDGAPYGTIEIDTNACTLCLACVSLCPPGALGENEDRPEVNFREEACVQCGLCANVCPESAITLKPQLDLRPSALSPRILHQEEPFACIECGKLFGVKSTIDRIVEKLAGQHHMFTNSDNVRLIQMCDDCRVTAQYHSEAAPFQGAARPPVRTTQDYLDERED